VVEDHLNGSGGAFPRGLPDKFRQFVRRALGAQGFSSGQSAFWATRGVAALPFVPSWRAQLSCSCGEAGSSLRSVALVCFDLRGGTYPLRESWFETCPDWVATWNEHVSNRLGAFNFGILCSSDNRRSGDSPVRKIRNVPSVEANRNRLFNSVLYGRPSLTLELAVSQACSLNTVSGFLSGRSIRSRSTTRQIAASPQFRRTLEWATIRHVSNCQFPVRIGSP
jgi:hypothetical protein